MVDRGLQLRQEIKHLQKQLKDIEDRLEALALARPNEHVPLKDPERDGRRWLACGASEVVPVVFCADRLVKSFQFDTPMHRQVLSAAEGQLTKFYGLKQVYEVLIDDGKRFRKQADELLGPAAPKFVAACLARDKHGVPKSDIKVTWDDAEEIGGGE
jgi:hypothetical protein